MAVLAGEASAVLAAALAAVEARPPAGKRDLFTVVISDFEIRY